MVSGIGVVTLPAGGRVTVVLAGLALVWPGEKDVALKWLGRTDATAPTKARHLGRPAIRYTVGGTAFGQVGGGPQRGLFSLR